jgi:protein-disulfide isomerase
MKIWFILMMLAVMLTGCGTVSPVEEPVVAATATLPFTATPRPTATHTAAPTHTVAAVATAAVVNVTATQVAPTDTPIPATDTPTPEPDWLNTVGRTADNMAFLGNPDASVVVIDYSDFM